MELQQSYSSSTVTDIGLLKLFRSSYKDTLHEVLRSGNAPLAAVAVLNPIGSVKKLQAASFALP